MIGSIDNRSDIELYLDSIELEKLSNETISGVIIKILKPKRQGTISLEINDKRQNENGFGIGINDSKYWGISDGFHLDVFMSSEYYDNLKKRGVVGLRQRMRDGSKINIYDKSRCQSTDIISVENLEFYRDNKNALPDYCK